MSGLYIESAYYGDEKSFVNITKSLANRIVGGVLDVTASSDLRPTFEAAPETRLTSADEQSIREAAARACGTAADQQCMERMIVRLSEERLQERENENMAANVIKGDRLTLNVVDDTGKRRKLVTPAGQQLRIENVLGGNVAEKDNILPSTDKVQEYAISVATVVASTFFWVFNIAAPYAVFMRMYGGNVERDYFRIAAYVSAALAAVFPGLGYIIILGYFGGAAFLERWRRIYPG